MSFDANAEMEFDSQLQAVYRLSGPTFQRLLLPLHKIFI